VVAAAEHAVVRGVGAAQLALGEAPVIAPLRARAQMAELVLGANLIALATILRITGKVYTLHTA
jgi:hypothetical protein